MSEIALQCQESWKLHCPDYEFKIWNEANSKEIQSKFYRDAIRETDAAARTYKEKRSDLRFRMGVAQRLLYELTDQKDPDLFGDSVEAFEEGREAEQPEEPRMRPQGAERAERAVLRAGRGSGRGTGPRGRRGGEPRVCESPRGSP